MMKTRRSILNQGGWSLIVFALAAPVVIVLALTGMELFMFFRATNLVKRAASEGAEAMAAALPGDKTGATSYISNTITSGNTRYGGTDTSYIFLWQRAGLGGTDEYIKELPFSLCRESSGCGTNLGFGQDGDTKNPGVQYLPMVSVYACQEPVNESAHNISNCRSTTGPSYASSSTAGYLTYLQPHSMDFDGDDVEDLAFFYPNSADDWWVITSASGTQFRDSLRVDLGAAIQNAGARKALPCPADYDGDGRTDFCVISADTEASGMEFPDPPASTTAYIHLRLSSQHYQKFSDIPITLPAIGLPLPVPGRYNQGTCASAVGADGVTPKDCFAAILIDVPTAGSTNYLATVIWGPFTVPVSPISTPTITAASIATSDSTYGRPAPGRMWRPAHSDVDGNGYVDVVWAEWEGGYPVTWIAGAGGLTCNQQGANPTATKVYDMVPWSIYYPRSPDALGLYVVHRNGHQVLLIDEGSDGIVNGDVGEGESVIPASWNNLCCNMCAEYSSTFSSPDPMANLSYGGGSQNCSGCAFGAPTWDNPTGAVTLGETNSKLFVSDYGTSKIAAITPEAGGQVNGQGAETTLWFGGIGSADGTDCPLLNDNLPTTCPAGCVGNGATLPDIRPATNVACPWNCYQGFSTSTTSVKARCVQTKPISLEIVKDSSTASGGFNNMLLIGDGDCIIWAVHPGTDTILGTTDDVMERFAGLYNASTGAVNCTSSGLTGTATSTQIGRPSSLALRVNSSGTLRDLLVGIRNNGTPINVIGGGVLQITPGASADFRSGTKDEVIAVLAGTFAATTVRPTIRNANNAVIFRNPSAIAASSYTNISNTAVLDPDVGVFIAGWWNDTGANTVSPYENSLLQYYQGPMGTAQVRWFNNYHSLSWGMRPPSESFSTTSVLEPLGNLSIPVGAGLAVSPDGQYLYIAATQEGKIYSVALDKDGDDLFDTTRSSCPASYTCTAYDFDPDGDSFANSAEASSDPLIFSPGGTSYRPKDALQDLLVFAEPFQLEPTWTFPLEQTLTAWSGTLTA